MPSSPTVTPTGTPRMRPRRGCHRGHRESSAPCAPTATPSMQARPGNAGMHRQVSYPSGAEKVALWCDGRAGNRYARQHREHLDHETRSSSLELGYRDSSVLSGNLGCTDLIAALRRRYREEWTPRQRTSPGGQRDQEHGQAAELSALAHRG